MLKKAAAEVDMQVQSASAAAVFLFIYNPMTIRITIFRRRHAYNLFKGTRKIVAVRETKGRAYFLNA